MRLRTLVSMFVPLSILACGSSESITSVPIEQTTFASSLGVNLSASTKTSDGLYYRDVVVGTGATIAAGTKLTSVKYSGALADGSVFDAGTLPGFTVPGNLIPGFNEGLLGMKVGGTRQLIIPPVLGYGAAGNGPIPPNAVIVFTVQPL
ncbi:MAG: FKBP-type peptidyl-prolyl cis-trans isomerase [bacterium]